MDKLRMDYINSLPQPFICRQFGRGIYFPIYDICVGTGLIRIEVMGKLDIIHISDLSNIVDDYGTEHDPDSFYSDYEESK